MRFLFELMMSFFKIGAFTLGGGYAMVPLIQEEVVENKGWIDETEFLNIIAIAQSAPGPIAINTAVFTGYKLRGITGAVFATLGAVLPSFLIIIVVATFFLSIKDSSVIKRAFMGIRPAVVALIVYSVVKMLKSNGVKGLALLIPLLSCMGIVLLNLHPILIIILAAISGIAMTTAKKAEIEE
ncbi:MAG: chromate transporter [Thermoanaerobacteraceae bacterium]|nr:chromate transporter [Thermoanaerobacteraceae bacterium]